MNSKDELLRFLRQEPYAVQASVSPAGEPRTVQYEGITDEPAGDELTQLLDLYFARFLDGKVRKASPDIAYFRVKPLWLRFSDFSIDPPRITEFRF